MEIKNYTSFWNLEKKIYSFYDVQLPMPLSLRVLLVFIVVMVPWGLLMFLFGVPLSPFGVIVWFFPPVAIAYACSRPIYQDKNLLEWASSMLGFVKQNRHYKRLEPDLNRYETDIEIEQTIITHKEKEGN